MLAFGPPFFHTALVHSGCPLTERPGCPKDMPWVKNQAVKLKLSKVYHGPFAIVKFYTATTVYLKDIRSGKFVLKPVAIGMLKKMGKYNIRAQEHVDQEAEEEEDPLEVSDIPLDSLIPDTHQQPDLNRAPPGQEAEAPAGNKDMVTPGDGMDGESDRHCTKSSTI